VSDTKLAGSILRERLGDAPEVGVVLGSGLGGLAEAVEERQETPYGHVPGFPMSTVAGHAGVLVTGRLSGRRVVLMRGRWHLYEGYDARQVTIGIRALAQWGVRSLLVTNAAGGISTRLAAGDLMLITDQINLTGTSPLRGTPAFIDMTAAYDPRWREAALGAARSAGIELKPGVYAGVAGPQYETPAEIRMFASLGADAVGMSTVLEVIAARHLGMRVLGLSCITNAAAGVAGGAALDHQDVLKTGGAASGRFSKLVTCLLPHMR
jgi:purine-nucleoside phosphorylase